MPFFSIKFCQKNSFHQLMCILITLFGRISYYDSMNLSKKLFILGIFYMLYMQLLVLVRVHLR